MDENDLIEQQAQAVPEPESQPQPEAQTEPQIEVQPQVEAQPQPQPQPQSQPQPQHQPQPQNHPWAMPPYTQAPAPNPWQSAPGYYTYQKPVYTPPAPPAQPQAKQKEGGFWKSVLISSVVALLCCGITAGCVSAYWQQRNNDLTRSFNEKLDILREEIQQNSHAGSGDSVSGSPGATEEGGLTPAQVYARNCNSVVAIECVVVEEYFGQFIEGTAAGSGFILSEDGYVVSNYHVVDGAETITVIDNGGKSYDAQYIGGDAANDIALLKIEAEGLKPVTVGSSDDLIVGDQVVAIGNPLGELASTLTVGYISAKDRIVTTDGTQINMLQTDAAINPGNSGGPLFNMKGQVIGITSAKYSGVLDSGATIEGIGFAIPVDDVMGMLEDLRDYGYITGAFLGVNVSNVDTVISELYGMPMGALVRSVVSGSCAQKGGIQAKDIITNLGGYDIENLNDLTRALRKFKAGDTVSVTVYRSGNQVQLSVVLDEKPQE
ncbi:MAG: trypsin-like peptidase domain-containing protein [Oscillospiraceae bacterium]|nr:trypsin-like peptidase domain-containing protein [Oscillospiraceae bacterium]